MKIKLISLAVTLLIFSASYSQINFGIKAGASINKITGKSFKDQFTYGYHAGGYVTLGLGGKLSIQPEVLFNQFKTDTSTTFSSVYQFNKVKNITLNYLSIPILLNYKLGSSLALQVGPQFGILIDKNKDLLKNGQEAFKQGDFSMIGGLQLKLLNFRIYGRYVVGLSDISNIGNADKWKSQSIQLGVGLGI
ncbi:MAG: porin family protein [Ginsengibacter sp.]